MVRLSPEDQLPFVKFELFGPNGTNLFSGEALGGGSAGLVLEAPLDGAYLLTAHSSGGATGGYEIEQLSTQTIDYDDGASGEIEQSGDITVFRFDAIADETSLVTVVASVNPTIDLYDPSGTLISQAAGFDAEPGEPWYLTAPTSTTGAYHVTVGGLDGSTGGFEISLQQPEVGDLALNQPAGGSIEDMTSVGVHQLSASAGDSIVVRIAPESEFEVARYELFAPGGALLKSGEVFADEWGLTSLEAPEDGTYLVTVGSRFGATGNYEIERLGASSLDIDQTAEGIVDDGDLSAFSFRANRGETMLITVVAPDVGLNPLIDLYDPQGDYVSTGDGFFDEPGEPWILASPISTSGLYHVTVTGFFDEERGPFHITLQRPEVSTLPLSTTVEGSIVDPVAVNVHRLNASAGDSIALNTTPDGDLATASVSVFGPDGAFVASESSYSDGSGLPIIFQAPSDGSYLVAVSGFQGSTGDYTVTRLGVRRLTVGQTVEDGLEGSSGVFVYSFDANEGEIPLITLDAPDDAQPTLDLYDADGFWVSSGVAIEESGGPLNLPTPVATSGVHHVTVSASGSFELEVTLSEWDVASLLPDLPELVQAEPIDYLQESGGSSVTCEDWDTGGLIEDDSVFAFPQYPLELNHSVWAFAASFDSADGVTSYIDSFGEGCILSVEPSIRVFPTAELHDGYLWYITTQPDSEGARELLDSVGVIGETDTDVVEIQLAINGFDGFVREIEIDPNAPYDNAEARELAEGLIEPLQSRLSEMSS